MSTVRMVPNPNRLCVTMPRGYQYTAEADVISNVNSVDVPILEAAGWERIATPESAEDPGALLASLNLSDLLSASDARTNLGLGTAAVADTANLATSTQGNTADTAIATANSAYASANTSAREYTVANITSNAANFSWNLSQGYRANITLTENATMLNPTGIAAAGRVVLTVTQNSGSNHTLAWDTGWLFAGGADPTITAANAAKDVLTFEMNTTNLLNTSIIQNLS